MFGDDERKDLVEMKKYSFIIPIYNCAKYILKCVEGIHNIGIEGYEIILINDGSLDDSDQICQRIMKSDKKIKYHYQKNKGVSVARNQGISMANGDYMVFLDVDDTIDSEKMKSILNILEKEDIDMAIYGLSFDYYYHEKIYRRDELKTPLSGMKTSDIWRHYIVDLYDANSLSPIWNKIIKRNILVENNLRFREDMFLYEDLEFSLRCMACCNEIYFSQNIVYHYRQSEDEGNAGRRLLRIKNISDLVYQIESSLNILLLKKKIKNYTTVSNNILEKLYIVLAKEKISVSNRKEIREICTNYKSWIKDHETKFSGNDSYRKMLLKQKVNSLILNYCYTSLRHKIAITIKALKARINTED